MTLREVLQTEIWSKETSRKIFRKFVVPFGIVFGVFAVVLGCYFAVDRFWLTPHERQMAREVLPQIDALQQNEGLNAGDFEKQKNLVQVKIDAAQRAAWTGKDQHVASLLSVYVEMIEFDRNDVERLKEISEKFPAAAQKIVAAEKKDGFPRGHNSLALGQLLHQILD